VKALAVVAHREHRQAQTYLEIGGYPLGLLLNFGAVRLVDGIKRVVNNFPHGGRRHPSDSRLEVPNLKDK
jgi:hypothetical protein